MQQMDLILFTAQRLFTSTKFLIQSRKLLAMLYKGNFFSIYFKKITKKRLYFESKKKISSFKNQVVIFTNFHFFCICFLKL